MVLPVKLNDITRQTLAQHVESRSVYAAYLRGALDTCKENIESLEAQLDKEQSRFTELTTTIEQIESDLVEGGGA
jgi:chromosome segregation ATPase